MKTLAEILGLPKMNQYQLWIRESGDEQWMEAGIYEATTKATAIEKISDHTKQNFSWKLEKI
jgi:hypothetical protein